MFHDIPISLQLAIVKTVFEVLNNQEHHLITAVWKAFLEVCTDEVLQGTACCCSRMFLFVFSCSSQVDSHPDCSAQGAVDVGEGPGADMIGPIGLLWFQHVPTLRGKEMSSNSCLSLPEDQRHVLCQPGSLPKSAQKARQVLM